MKIDMPFFRSLKNTDCGPLALKMALGYLGEEHGFEEISGAERQLESGLVWSAGIVRAAKKFGFNVRFISKENFNHEEKDIDYYKKYANNKAMLVLRELIDELDKLGIEVEEKDMKLEELLSYVSEGSVPIVLVNWYAIAGKEGFSGHFLPVSGYDEENVYVHNPGLAGAQAFLPIKRDVFVKAWESKGTDKDAIVIFRKK